MIESRFRAFGFDCMVRTTMGYRCGYVIVPWFSPLNDIDYQDERLEFADAAVHGGLTFSGQLSRLKDTEDDDRWAFGFDCAHFGDAYDVSLVESQEEVDFIERTMSFVGHHWTLPEVTDETITLARELSKIEADLFLGRDDVEYICDSCHNQNKTTMMCDVSDRPGAYRTQNVPYMDACNLFSAK